MTIENGELVGEIVAVLRAQPRRAQTAVGELIPRSSRLASATAREVTTWLKQAFYENDSCQDEVNHSDTEEHDKREVAPTIFIH